MGVAYDPDSGKAHYLDQNGKWVETKTATDPDSGKVWVLQADNTWTPEPVYTPPEPGIISQAITGITKAWTGEGRGSGYPELPATVTQMPDGSMGMAQGQMSWGATDKDKLDIFKRFMADAGKPLMEGQYGIDDGGAWVSQEGKRYYLDAPGMSPQNWSDLFLGTVVMGPFARFGGAGGQALGAVGRIAGTGIGSGVGSVALDVGGQGMGSEQGVSLPRALLAAGFGAAGEGLAAVIGRLATGLRTNMTYIDQQTGRLTAQGEEYVRSLGLDPAGLNQQILRDIMKQATGAFEQNPVGALAAAEARSLPHPVALSRGQISGSPVDQGFEGSALAGAYGQRPYEVMEQGFQAQGTAMRSNIDALRGQFGGQGADPRSAAAGLQSELAGQARQAKTIAGDAFSAARQASAGFPSESVNAVAYNLRIGMDVSPSVAPKVAGRLSEFEALAGRGQFVNLNELFALRRDLVALGRNMDAEGVAAKNA